MKPPRLLALAALLATCLLPLVACDSSTPDETAPDTPTVTTEAPTEAVTLSPEEQVAADRQAYLDTVTYRDFVLTGEEAPYYMGRWFDKDIDGIPHKVTLTDGAHLYFMVENATSFDVAFTVITTGAEPYFAYSIDGAEPIRQHITEPTVTLPDTGRHTVRIIADGMTEGEGKWDQEKGFAVRSVTPSEGGSLMGIRPTEKVIFFYGDSITEGIRALNMNATSDGNSATNAYSWQCAEALGVTPYLIGYGASGIIMPGSFHTMLNAIDYLSDGRPVDNSISPDIIVVNHGSNDVGQNRQLFEEQLTVTLNRLREKYPEAPIVYLIPFEQTHSRVIPGVVEKMENAYVIETRGWKISYTDGIHPDVAGAKYAGEQLAAALVEIFGEDYFKN